MKKIVLIITFILFLTGCLDIKNSSYEQIINFALNNQKDLKNKSNSGYSYYLPTGLKIVSENKFNIVFQSEKYHLYMYVDAISYYNKKIEKYQENNISYVSKSIQKDDKFGYLEINKRENDKYLVEIMYNYAKIELIVDEIDLKEMVSFAMAILSSVSYNDTILENMIGEDTLNYSEIEFNIFETAQNDNNLIKYDENMSPTDDNNDIPDLDLVN